ncbi:MAG: UvrD-helicase domain-containing protein [Bacteroidales bacterium]|jgi:ATP-dependent exoDNAse (exonuclease V) beta subunit
MALKVYKASAGTGKTYRLTLMYLSLLLGNVSHFDPNAFLRILAVTFTNKATEEMKARILDTLESLAKGNASHFTDDLGRETGLPFETLVTRASQVHQNLLHRYSYFSVSTLDAFFQKVLRSFILEAGLSTGYSIDTDTDFLLENTAGQIVQKIPDDDSLRTWFGELIKEKVSRADKWDVADLLKQVGRQVTRESFRAMGEAFAGKISDRVFLKAFILENRVIIDSFETTMKGLGEKALTLINDNGFTVMDFPYKNGSFAGYFLKISAIHPSAEAFAPGVRVLEAMAGKDLLWYNKNSPEGLQKMQGILIPVMQEIHRYYSVHFKLYVTALAVREQLPQMGLLADVITTMRRIQEENNTLDIGDSTYLLNKLVGDGNTPFIYERMGAGYDSFLLDEFQDTSYLQWQNMYPLLINGLAQGADSLIVGDVKQSIYRWRNSDWRILGEQITADPLLRKHGVDLHTLQTNWRSKKEIVMFVNDLIENVKNSLNSTITAKINGSDAINEADKNYLENLLNNAYANFQEKMPDRNTVEPCGYVQINTFNAEESSQTEDKTLNALKDELIALIKRGYSASDILILVRSKENARTITRFLLQYEMEHIHEAVMLPRVISEDALYLSSSPYVTLAVAVLKLSHYPQDTCNAQTVLRLSEEYGKKDISGDSDFLERLRFMPLADAMEAIIQRMEWTQCREAIPYLQELHDALLRFSGRDSGGVFAFLKWWDIRGKETMLTAELPEHAVRLLTIHKAKGLEAPVVMIPFCNWPLDSRAGRSVIWTKTSVEPFNRLEQIPVVYDNKLMHTCFAPDFYLEYSQRILDALNLLYVAVTRPREELYVYLPFSKKNSKDNIACPVREALPFRTHTDDEVLRFGNPSPTVHSPKKSSEGYIMDEYPSAGFGDKLKLVYREDTFEYSPSDSMRQWGLVLHKALSRVETIDQVEQVLQGLVQEGELAGNRETAEQFTRAIKKTLLNPEIARWFDGSWKVRNEASVLGRFGKMRPDRVMEKEGRTVILDYKFGKPEPSHERQMKNYVEVLLRMGYTSVEGHVLYIEH